MRLIRDDTLTWVETAFPGSDPPPQLARLPDGPGPIFRALVRFPPNWTRPGTGHYREDEELLVLAGDLTVSGTRWEAGGYAWLPAGHVREASRSAGGCLAFAWFSGPPRWRRGGPGAPAGGAVSHAHWRAAPRRTAPLGNAAHLLHGAPGHATWITEGTAGGVALAEDAEVFSLDDRAWAAVEVGEALPSLSGPCLLRLYRAGDGSSRSLA